MIKQILSFIILSAIMFSCAGPISIQKRRYNRGFHFSFAHHVKSQNQITESKSESKPTQTPTKNSPVELTFNLSANQEIENKSFNQMSVPATAINAFLPFKHKILSNGAKKILQNRILTKQNYSPEKLNYQVNKKFVKGAILKKVLRKVLRKIGFLCLMLGGILYLVSLALPEMQPLAMLFIFAGLLLIIIAILTRLT